MDGRSLLLLLAAGASLGAEPPVSQGGLFETLATPGTMKPQTARRFEQLTEELKLLIGDACRGTGYRTM